MDTHRGLQSDLHIYGVKQIYLPYLRVCLDTKSQRIRVEVVILQRAACFVYSVCVRISCGG